MTDKKRFTSVWDAIEDTPQEAASMRARSYLMMNLAEAIRTKGMTQGQAATLFGVTQPRISDLMRGKVSLFSLDTLIDMAATAGMTPMVKVSMPKVGQTKRDSRRTAGRAWPRVSAAVVGRSRYEEGVTIQSLPIGKPTPTHGVPTKGRSVPARPRSRSGT